MFEAADEAIEIIAPSVRIDRDGWAYHGYLSDRFRLGSRTVMEVGLRWDHQDWVEDSQISPRANLKFDVGTRTEARIGWGRFHQSQRLNEIPVEDGAIDFHEAEQAEHRVLSVVHRFVNDWTLRGGLYEKRFDHLRPRYENLFSRLELFPESREDRVLVDPERGYARGLELMLRNGMTAQVAWWLGYTLSEANDVIDGVDVPRNWDQRHGLDGGMAFRLPWKLSLGLAGTWHSGRPMTGVTVEWERDEDELEPVIVPASRNGERLGNYGRLDLRIGREFSTRHGSGEVVLQVFNATNRRNVCHIEDFQILNDEDGVRVVPEEQICSSIIPTLDLRWRF